MHSTPLPFGAKPPQRAVDAHLITLTADACCSSGQSLPNGDVAIRRCAMSRFPGPPRTQRRTTVQQSCNCTAEGPAPPTCP